MASRVAGERPRGDEDLEQAVLATISHPRYGGSYLPVWRILDAIGHPRKPAAVRWTLQRLEAQGRAEHRRTPSGQLEWRAGGDRDSSDVTSAASVTSRIRRE